MMCAYFRKGVTVWIFGFLTIVAFLNVFNSTMMWIQNGDTLFQPYLIDQFIGFIQVSHYFWISLLTGFIFLGCTAFSSFRDDFKILSALEAQRRAQMDSSEAYRTILKSHTNLEDGYRTILKSHTNLETHIENVTLKSQEQLETYIDNAQAVLSKALSKQEPFIKRVNRLGVAVEKVKKEFDDVKKSIQSLELELLPRNPQITAESSPMEIGGIGPIITKELGMLGITNAGEFLLADPGMISACTHLSRDQAEYLQGKIQLLMIPGIDKTKIELFEKVGVTNRKELALQDPFALNIKLLKAYSGDEKYLKYERPTFEEVLSWVRTAKM